MLTLSEFYRSRFIPIWIHGRRLDSKTEYNYRDSIARWSELTDDPRLDQITDHTVAAFISKLCEQKGRDGTLKMSTVAKHCRNVDTVLKMAGPRSRTNRRGQEILAREPPFVEAPRVDREAPTGDWSIAEVRAMYAAASTMTVPIITGVDPAAWWRTLICVFYYTGLRTNALMQIEFSMITDQSIIVPAQLSKRRKGKRQFLHSEALEHIERIRTDRPRILGWPRTQRMSYVGLRDLQHAAGINESRQWGFQSFRKTHLTMLAGLSLEHEHGLQVAQQSAGHSNLAITLGHYVSGDLQARLVAAAINRMPSPVAPSEVDRHNDFID